MNYIKKLYIQRLMLLLISLFLFIGMTSCKSDWMPDVQDHLNDFSILKGVWETDQTITTENTGKAYSPEVAFDTDGNAFIVWNQFDDDVCNIYAMRYTPSDGWKTPEIIGSNADGPPSTDVTYTHLPQIAFDNMGNAIVVWREFYRLEKDGLFYYYVDIWANRYTPDSGWGAAQCIESDEAWEYESDTKPMPMIAFDNTGNALAVWRKYDNSGESAVTYIRSNRYIYDSDWEGTETIYTDDTAQSTNPQISFDTGNNAIAIWNQSNNGTNIIQACHYIYNSDWQETESVETEYGSSVDAFIGLGPGGTITVVWIQNDIERDNIWSKRYTPENGWENTEPIDTKSKNSYTFITQLAVDNEGNAFLFGNDYNDSESKWNIFSYRFSKKSGWGEIEYIQTGHDDGMPLAPQVSFDPEGNAIVTWYLDLDLTGTKCSVYANRYVIGFGWGDTELIQNDGTGSGIDQGIAFDNSGNAVAVWNVYDGENRAIQMNQFKVP